MQHSGQADETHGEFSKHYIPAPNDRAP